MSASPQPPFGGDLPPHRSDSTQPAGWHAPPTVVQWDGRQWVQAPMHQLHGGEHHGPAHHVYPPVPTQDHTQPVAADYTFRAQVQPGAAAWPATHDAAAAGQIPAAVPHERSALALVIAFVAAAVALWAIVAYMGETTRTLASVKRGNDQLAGQMIEANAGLDQLQAKTLHVRDMSDYSARLAELMIGIDGNMADMLQRVDGMAGSMATMNGSLTTLDGELDKVATSEASLNATLVDIDKGLAGQASSVSAMRRDLQSTSGVLATLPDMLRTTNDRLAYINRIVCKMGLDGQATEMEISIEFMGLPTGSARIFATMIPAGAWTC